MFWKEKGQPENQARSDDQIIARYTRQPSRLPPALRARIEDLWGGQPVQLYALADLDDELNLAQIWLALGPEQIAIARLPAGHGVADEGSADDAAMLAEAQIAACPIECIARNRIAQARELPGLSSTCLVLEDAVSQDPGAPGAAVPSVPSGPAASVLAQLRYTHRQRRAMENIKYLLNLPYDGAPPEPGQGTLEPDRLYARAVAGPVTDAQAAVAGRGLSVVWRLLAYLLPYKGRLALGTVAALFMTGLNLLPPYLTKLLIDDVARPFQAGQLAVSEAVNLGWIVIAGLAACYVTHDFCHWVRLKTMAVLGEYVARDLRRELYEHLQKLSLSFYTRKQTGTIISRVSSDSDRLWDFIAFGVVEVSLSVLMLLGLSVVLISLDWRLGLVMVLPLPLIFAAFAWHSQAMNRLFLRAWRSWSGVTEVLSDTIPGMRVVKAFHQERREVKRFNRQNETAVRAFNDTHDVWTRFWPRLMLGLHLIILTVWVLALPRLLSPAGAADHLSFGTFVAFLLYIGMFIYPIETVGMVARMLNRATSSAQRIFEVLDTEPDLPEPTRPVQVPDLKGAVSFEKVSFSYDGLRPVLDEVSFSVAPGEMIGLVGPSGAGKSTVISLIARFYAPTRGVIRIDGHDLARLESDSYRRQIGIVQQDPHLFHGSIFDNIRYGRPDADPAAVVEAARAANAHDFICRLAHGYDTVVGERGLTLSGGERQRISIARAILCDPRILILDEATSAVDTETEHRIQEALDRLVTGRTVFAIAHRLSTLRGASRIFVFDKGRLVEQGGHAELLAREDGLYRRLSSLQQQLHGAYGV